MVVAHRRFPTTACALSCAELTPPAVVVPSSQRTVDACRVAYRVADDNPLPFRLRLMYECPLGPFT